MSEPQRRVLSTDPNAGQPMRPVSAARVQGDTKPGQFVNEMLRNVPADLIEQGKNVATGTYDLLSVLAKATAETGAGVGNFLREVVGLEPHSAGTENLQRLGGVPSAVAEHYGQYLDPDARAERVREHPVGMALDLMPVAGALRSGVPAATSVARRGAAAAAQVPGRVADTAIGVFRGSPTAAVRGALGHGPVEAAKRAMATAPVVAEASPAAPVAPPASSPAAPAPSAAPSVPAAAPARPAGSTPSPGPAGPAPRYGQHPLADPPFGGGRAQAPAPSDTVMLRPAQRTAGQMSPTWIKSDLGMSARRQGVTLTEPQYKAATELVHQGQSPAEAVAEIAKRTAVAPSAASATPAAATPSTPSAPSKAKVPKRAKLTADEADEYLRLTGKGMSNDEAVEALMAQRKLAAKLGTPSPESARRRVAEHNVTGRWPE